MNPIIGKERIRYVAVHMQERSWLCLFLQGDTNRSPSMFFNISENRPNKMSIQGCRSAGFNITHHAPGNPVWLVPELLISVFRYVCTFLFTGNGSNAHREAVL